jgi:hypothetical protein
VARLALDSVDPNAGWFGRLVDGAAHWLVGSLPNILDHGRLIPIYDIDRLVTHDFFGWSAVDIDPNRTVLVAFSNVACSN